ncbi:iron-containing alcohol dehydrogenase family protein [Halostella litorea]|uniref:iron-containing alcohol dehydrogenase family protein n=1 Tax=Halostella litorea TaxID=2528831 RepID=UPI001092C7D9|nr:iron-containing alcohol dehydrogenase family protein [Halostella litorea]
MTSRRPNGTERFAYDPPAIRFGRGSVAELADELAAQGVERALVVCGETVGDTPAVMDPVLDGLGDRLGSVFAETTPEKRLRTAVDGAAAMRAADADAVVSLGGGSSLDTAKAVAVLAASDRSPEDAGREFAERGTLTVPDGVPPVVAVPTTLAGADLSQVAGLTAAPAGGLVDEPVGGGLDDPQLMPAAAFYDPELFATTPWSVLSGSAMNGFDKGIETLYARSAAAVTDATAARGLSLLADGLPALGRDRDDADALDRVVEGTMLVQYGISRPDGTTLSLIHAFGHGLTAHSSVQQGAAHAIVAPHALRYLFERVDGRRRLLAEALGVAHEDLSDHAVAEAVVDEVRTVRDALDLPTRLRSVDDLPREAFPAVADDVVTDGFVGNAPPGLDLTRADVEAVLDDAW